jgi:prepilin-type N-terminal cleavage/methylation domain-containing protein
MSTDRKKAFTLIEVLVTLAIILILAGTMITAGKYLRVRAERQLTQSAIEVICTALQQYYDQTGSFPPVVDNAAALKTAIFGSASPLTITVSRGTHPVPDSNPMTEDTGTVFWRSESLFYFLERIPQSKAILNGLSNQMLSNKDKTGIGLQVEIPTGGTTYDWVRFVDTWGTSLNYTYTVGDVFPVLTSAGPDKIFKTAGPDGILGTSDDVESADNLSSQ